MRNRSQGELILEKSSSNKIKTGTAVKKQNGLHGQTSVDFEQEEDMALNLMQAKDPRNSQFGNSVFKDSSVAYDESE